MLVGGVCPVGAQGQVWGAAAWRFEEALRNSEGPALPPVKFWPHWMECFFEDTCSPRIWAGCHPAVCAESPAVNAPLPTPSPAGPHPGHRCVLSLCAEQLVHHTLPHTHTHTCRAPSWTTPCAAWIRSSSCMPWTSARLTLLAGELRWRGLGQHGVGYKIQQDRMGWQVSRGAQG